MWREISSKIPFYVITVNYKSKKYLEILINSLLRISNLNQLIIVDNSGELRQEEFALPIPVRLISNANRGYGAGLNRGLKEVQEEDAIVLMCNPDIRIITPEALENVVNLMIARPRIGAILPRIVDHEGHHVVSCRRFYTLWTLFGSRISSFIKYQPEFMLKHNYAEKGLEESFEIDWGSGAAIFCRLSTFPDRKCFDERFFLYFEDVDFGMRLKHQGLKLLYFPSFVIEHEGALRSHRNPLFLWLHIVSLIKFLWKYSGFPKVDSEKLKVSNESGNPSYSRLRGFYVKVIKN
ncbi:MAG: glycosyltransferase [Syntrophaceae bacterium]|nr:glycosyltransferase [Syntrophaceae bacterium]